MESLEEEDDERFKKQFATYLADDIGSEDIEDIYKEAHAAIREDPSPEKAEDKKDEYKKASQKYRLNKISLQERKEKVAKKIADFKVSSRNHTIEDIADQASPFYRPISRAFVVEELHRGSSFDMCLAKDCRVALHFVSSAAMVLLPPVRTTLVFLADIAPIEEYVANFIACL